MLEPLPFIEKVLNHAGARDTVGEGDEKNCDNHDDLLSMKGL